MGVSGLAPAGRDRVDVEVEDRRGEEDEVREAGLLAPLAQRGGSRVGLALVVSAHLEPAVEAPVVVEEDATRVRREDEDAAREVAGGERRAGEAGGLGLDEGEHRLAVSLLGLVVAFVGAEGGAQGGAGRIEGLRTFAARHDGRILTRQSR